VSTTAMMGLLAAIAAIALAMTLAARAPIGGGRSPAQPNTLCEHRTHNPTHNPRAAANHDLTDDIEGPQQLAIAQT
jgi:hypothetical protein